MVEKIINAFPGYEFIDGKNMYRGTNVGFGGYIYSNPGVYGNVALLDVASMHPHSIIAMNLFGEHTKNFKDLVDARIAIKRGDYETAKGMLNGRLAPYLENPDDAKGLAQALKIAINSVYGLTAAGFDNPLRDPRNKNNIVALRGALFMRTLQDEVESRGYSIVAIKTDSIKIADASPEIVEFCMDFAKKYGYTFEHEATYEKICQINDADYVAKYQSSKWCELKYGYIPSDNKKKGEKWTATGKAFQIPYVFKTLFSHEGIEFKDLCVTNSVKTALYLDINENMYINLLLEHGWFDTVSCFDDETVKIGLKSLGIKKKEADEILANPALHDYKFVGKVGSFCPIMVGKGGGLLMRAKDGGGYSAATGSKGFRWLEAEDVEKKGLTCDIDMGYFEGLVETARKAIEEYCDFTWFVSDDPYIPGAIPYVVVD